MFDAAEKGEEEGYVRLPQLLRYFVAVARNEKQSRIHWFQNEAGNDIDVAEHKRVEDEMWRLMEEYDGLIKLGGDCAEKEDD